MKGILIGKVILMVIAPPAGLLSSAIGIINHIARYETGRAWLEKLEKTAINVVNLLSHLDVNKTVPELREAIWTWARILFGVTLAVSFLRSEVLLMVFALSAVIFSLSALSLQAISQTRSVLTLAVVAPVVYVLVFTGCLIIGLRVDSNLAFVLTRLAYEGGLSHPSSLAGFLIAVAIFALIMLVLHGAILILLALIGTAFVLAIWFVVKLSAFLSQRYDREILNQTTARVALIFSVVGVMAYIFL